MTFLRELLANRPVKVTIPFGINERVRIVSIDNEPRKRNGEIQKMNTYIKMVKFDEDDNKVSSTEFSWFNPVHDNSYLFENVATQLTQLGHIAEVLGAEEELDPTVGYETEEEMIEELSSKKGLKAFLSLTWELFNEAIGDKVGPESQLLDLKVVTDWTGKRLELPKTGDFLSLHVPKEDRNDEYTPELSIKSKEIIARQKGTEPDMAKPDAEGNKPPEEELSSL